MKKHIRGLYAAEIVLLLICCMGLLYGYVCLQNQDRIVVSLESGIYSGKTQISVQIFQKGAIYYTLDGQEASENGDNVLPYEEPLILDATHGDSVYCFHFFVVYEDGTISDTVERNYLILDDEREITTNYVVMVWGKEDELFSNEEGIFVRGNQFYEYMEQNPNVDILGTVIPANYFSNKEVEVHSVLFDLQGQEIVAQNSGLKIYGNVTRAKNQKSFRLIARYLYDDVNEFSFSFSDKLVSDRTNSVITSLQRISLHNSGNDNGYGFIRNTLCNELARQAGFPDTLVSESATVYINGRYMGVYWLQNTYDDRYFQEKYGIYEGEMAVVEGRLCEVEKHSDQEIWEQEAVSEYNKFCEWLLKADIKKHNVWQRVLNTIDVDNLIQYVAIEYYLNNTTDWPHNNVKAYRYVAGEGEEYQQGTVFDGRFRYLLYDMDYGLGLKMLGWFGSDAESKTLWNIAMNTSSSSGIFVKLMERQECREAFVNEVLSLRNSVFSEENICSTLDQLNRFRWEELTYMMEETDILKNSLWESDDNNIENVRDELAKIKYFASVRGEFVLDELAQTWECGQLFQIQPQTSDGVQVCVNGHLVIGGELYYSKMAFTLSAETEGMKVEGWYVNGEYFEGETIHITPQDYLTEDTILYVMPRCIEVLSEKLAIESYVTKGTQDWVEIKNGGNTDIDLDDWFVSDDQEEPMKGRLPKIVLKPGESILVYGEKYTGDKVECSFQVDFSWNREESIVLSNLKTGIVEVKSR